jgi:hypothetical protein
MSDVKDYIKMVKNVPNEPIEDTIETTLKPIMVTKTYPRETIERWEGQFEFDWEEINKKRSDFIKEHLRDPTKLKVKLPKGTLKGMVIE